MITNFENLANRILNGELSGYFLTRNGQIKVESWYLRQNKIRDKIGDMTDRRYPYIIVGGDLKGAIFTIEGKYMLDYLDSDFDLVEFFPYAETNKQKNMKTENERTVKLTLEKACEWYQKGDDLKDVALQAFTEEEINNYLNAHKYPTSWDEYYKQKRNQHAIGYYLDNDCCNIRQFHYEFCVNPSIGRDVLPSRELAEAFPAMMQLISLRQEWIHQWSVEQNLTEDWKPVWNNGKISKWCIDYWKNTVGVYHYCITSRPLSFPTKEMAEDFTNTFIDLLEIAKPLI